jgi:HK97 family phage major capsid protein
MAKKTIAEQIAAFTAKSVANEARMLEIMDQSGEEGSTLDETAREEYDTLKAENVSITDHIQRLKDHEVLMSKSALPADGGSTLPIRPGAVISMRGNNLPKGTGFTRYAMALARSKGNLVQAVEISKQWHDSTPEVETVLKAAVASGDTTSSNWAVELADYTYMASEFIDLLRPATIIGRIQGFRRVPFMIRMPAVAAGVSAAWVGQGLGKPLSSMDFDTVTLAQNKIACIVVLTEELVRFSSPAAEAVVRQDMIDAMSQYMDQQFIDPLVAVSGTVRPASITNGASNNATTGTTIAAITTDVGVLMNKFIAANITLRAGVWVMHPRTALYLSMLRTAQDVFAYPTIQMSGGSFYGMPVITSANVPIDTGNDTYMILMDASEVFLADDGGVSLDISREASLNMVNTSDAKDNPTTMVSLWQHNLVGLRAERYITYKRRRTAAVSYIKDIIF